MVRVWWLGAVLGGSTTGSVRLTSGASCEVSVVDGASGTTSSSPSRRASPSECAR